MVAESDWGCGQGKGIWVTGCRPDSFQVFMAWVFCSTTRPSTGCRWLDSEEFRWGRILKLISQTIVAHFKIHRNTEWRQKLAGCSGHTPDQSYVKKIGSRLCISYYISCIYEISFNSYYISCISFFLEARFL